MEHNAQLTAVDRGRETSIAAWFRRWRQPVRRFLIAKGAFRVADIDDLAQEVFLRLLRYDSADVVEHPQAYLFKIAGNVAAEWAVRAHRRLAHDSRWLGSLVAEDVLETSFDSGVVQLEIERALTRLTDRERLIIKLHFEEGLTQGAISLQLGVSLRIVRRDFESSYAKLRRELKVSLTGALRHGRE